MRNRTRTRRLLAVTVFTLAGLSWSALPGLAVPVTVFDAELVFRGGPGETRTWTWVNDPAHIGQPCTVTATVENGESEHAGNVLDVGPLRAVAIEAEAWGTTTLTGQLTLGETGTASVTLSDDPAHAWRPPTDRRPGVWVFSGRLTVEVTCTDLTTTTTSTSVTTSSSSSTSTTTAPSTTTSSSIPPATTTTVPSESTTTTSPNPTTSVPATTSTTTPDPTTSTVPSTSSTVPTSSTSSTVPPITGSTLPFTGPPVEPASVAMAAAALLLLGGGILRAVRTGA